MTLAQLQRLKNILSLLPLLVLLMACGPMGGKASPKAPSTSKTNVALDATEQDIGANDGSDDGADDDEDEAVSDDDDSEDDVDDDEDSDDEDSDDEDSDDDDDADDEDDDVGSRSALTVNVKDRKDGGTVLKVKVSGSSSSWSSLTLPNDGVATIPNICAAKGKGTKIEVAFVNEETGEVRVGSSHVAVTGSGSTAVTIAFDDEADGTPDDNIVVLRCGSGTLQVR